MLIIYIAIFFLGASFASFLNATLYRIDKGFSFKKTVKKPSHCESCKKELKWFELIPVLGYILIGGKCTGCNKKINIIYPLSEFLLGISFLLLFSFSIPWYLWIVVIFLFALSYFDFLYRGIPKFLTHIFLFLCIIFFLLFSRTVENLYFPILLAMFLILVNLIKKSMGLGDILVLLGTGILLSKEQYTVMFWSAIVLALLYPLILVIKGEKNIKKIKVPMIPFFTISFVLTLICGEQIYIFFLNLLEIW